MPHCFLGYMVAIPLKVSDGLLKYLEFKGFKNKRKKGNQIKFFCGQFHGSSFHSCHLATCWFLTYFSPNKVAVAET